MRHGPDGSVGARRRLPAAAPSAQERPPASPTLTSGLRPRYPRLRYGRPTALTIRVRPAAAPSAQERPPASPTLTSGLRPRYPRLRYGRPTALTIQVRPAPPPSAHRRPAP